MLHIFHIYNIIEMLTNSNRQLGGNRKISDMMAGGVVYLCESFVKGVFSCEKDGCTRALHAESAEGQFFEVA